MKENNVEKEGYVNIELCCTKILYHVFRSEWTEACDITKQALQSPITPLRHPLDMEPLVECLLLSNTNSLHPEFQSLSLALLVRILSNCRYQFYPAEHSLQLLHILTPLLITLSRNHTFLHSRSFPTDFDSNRFLFGLACELLAISRRLPSHFATNKDDVPLVKKYNPKEKYPPCENSLFFGFALSLATQVLTSYPLLSLLSSSHKNAYNEWMLELFLSILSPPRNAICAEFDFSPLSPLPERIIPVEEALSHCHFIPCSEASTKAFSTLLSHFSLSERSLVENLSLVDSFVCGVHQKHFSKHLYNKISSYYINEVLSFLLQQFLSLHLLVLPLKSGVSPFMSLQAAWDTTPLTNEVAENALLLIEKTLQINKDVHENAALGISPPLSSPVSPLLSSPPLSSPLLSSSPLSPLSENVEFLLTAFKLILQNDYMSLLLFLRGHDSKALTPFLCTYLYTYHSSFRGPLSPFLLDKTLDFLQLFFSNPSQLSNWAAYSLLSVSLQQREEESEKEALALLLYSIGSVQDTCHFISLRSMINDCLEVLSDFSHLSKRDQPLSWWRRLFSSSSSSQSLEGETERRQEKRGDEGEDERNGGEKRGEKGTGEERGGEEKRTGEERRGEERRGEKEEERRGVEKMTPEEEKKLSERKQEILAQERTHKEMREIKSILQSFNNTAIDVYSLYTKHQLSSRSLSSLHDPNALSQAFLSYCQSIKSLEKVPYEKRSFQDNKITKMKSDFLMAYFSWCRLFLAVDTTTINNLSTKKQAVINSLNAVVEDSTGRCRPTEERRGERLEGRTDEKRKDRRKLWREDLLTENEVIFVMGVLLSIFDQEEESFRSQSQAYALFLFDYLLVKAASPLSFVQDQSGKNILWMIRGLRDRSLLWKGNEEEDIEKSGKRMRMILEEEGMECLTYEEEKKMSEEFLKCYYGIGEERGEERGEGYAMRRYYDMQVEKSFERGKADIVKREYETLGFFMSTMKSTETLNTETWLCLYSRTIKHLELLVEATMSGPTFPLHTTPPFASSPFSPLSVSSPPPFSPLSVSSPPPVSLPVSTVASTDVSSVATSLASQEKAERSLEEEGVPTTPLPADAAPLLPQVLVTVLEEERRREKEILLEWEELVDLYLSFFGIICDKFSLTESMRQRYFTAEMLMSSQLMRQKILELPLYLMNFIKSIYAFYGNNQKLNSTLQKMLPSLHNLMQNFLYLDNQILSLTFQKIIWREALLLSLKAFEEERQNKILRVSGVFSPLSSKYLSLLEFSIAVGKHAHINLISFILAQSRDLLMTEKETRRFYTQFCLKHLSPIASKKVCQLLLQHPIPAKI